MTDVGHGFSAFDENGKEIVIAKNPIADEISGSISFDCPVDVQHYIVPLGTRNFLCKIHGGRIFIP